MRQVIMMSSNKNTITILELVDVKHVPELSGFTLWQKYYNGKCLSVHTGQQLSTISEDVAMLISAGCNLKETV